MQNTMKTREEINSEIAFYAGYTLFLESAHTYLPSHLYIDKFSHKYLVERAEAFLRDDIKWVKDTQ